MKEMKEWRNKVENMKCKKNFFEWKRKEGNVGGVQVQNLKG